MQNPSARTVFFPQCPDICPECGILQKNTAGSVRFKNSAIAEVYTHKATANNEPQGIYQIYMINNVNNFHTEKHLEFQHE
jgi:hypothetical protein